MGHPAVSSHFDCFRFQLAPTIRWAQSLSHESLLVGVGWHSLLSSANLLGRSAWMVAWPPSPATGDVLGLVFALRFPVLRLCGNPNADSCPYPVRISGWNWSVAASALFRMGLLAGESLHRPRINYFAFLRHGCLFACSFLGTEDY